MDIIVNHRRCRVYFFQHKQRSRLADVLLAIVVFGCYSLLFVLGSIQLLHASKYVYMYILETSLLCCHKGGGFEILPHVFALLLIVLFAKNVSVLARLSHICDYLSL